MKGHKWLGTGYGLVEYNDTTWKVYTNSAIRTSTIAIDSAGNKWFGTPQSGVVKFDDSRWTIFNTVNSGLPDDHIQTITIDAKGNKWIGTEWRGLVMYNDTAWTVYDTTNSGLPDNTVLSIVTDSRGNKWIGTRNGGLAKFNDTTWTVFNTFNSRIPGNYITSLAFDSNGNLWIGSYGGGLAVFNEGGTPDPGYIPVTEYILFNNYPNPFNPNTTIRYSVPQSSNVTIRIYDILGNLIETIVNEVKPEGTYEQTWQAAGYSSGIYFYSITCRGIFTNEKDGPDEVNSGRIRAKTFTTLGT